jgi:hypothetical protein
MRRVVALELARGIAPVLSELGGMSARAAAAELNARQVGTPSGAPWSAKTVIGIRERLADGRASLPRGQAGGFAARGREPFQEAVCSTNKNGLD